MIPVHERKILEAFVRGIAFSRLALETRDLNEYEVLQLQDLVKQRIKGIPLQYLVGSQDFYGREFYVNTSVLIPRPETEGLVELALRHLPVHTENQTARLHGLEFGTGSGCISITLALLRPEMWMTATDCSKDALTVAQENRTRYRALNVDLHHVSSDVHRVDYLRQYEDFPTEFDFIISNPPYLLTSDAIAKDVREHEPHEALFVPDSDPLYFYGFLLELMKVKVKTGGYGFFEIADTRSEKVRKLFNEAGFETVVNKDLAGQERYLIVRPGICSV